MTTRALRRCCRSAVAITIVIMSLMVFSAGAGLTLPYEGSAADAEKAFRINDTRVGTELSHGAHLRADDAQERGQNYGGYFVAEGDKGVGLFAIGGLHGYAALFEGDIKIAGADNGIVFPDGSKQTTAVNHGGGGGSGCCSRPAYDSGWVPTPSGSPTQLQQKLLTHNLSGHVDDYVVDLQMKLSTIAGPQGPTNQGIGSSFYYTGLTTTDITVWGPGSAIDAETFLRVRIWLVNCDGGSSEPERY